MTTITPSTSLLLLLLLLLPVGQAIDMSKAFVYQPLYSSESISLLDRLADSLSDAHFNVTVLTPLLDRRLMSRYSNRREIIRRRVDDITRRRLDQLIERHRADVWPLQPVYDTFTSHFQDLLAILVEHCDELLTDHRLLSNMAKRQFDVVLTDALDPCGIALCLLFDPSVCALVSTTSRPPEAIDAALGTPLTPAYVPAFGSTRPRNMTLLERFHNVWQIYQFDSNWRRAVARLGQSLTRYRTIADVNDASTTLVSYYNSPSVIYLSQALDLPTEGARRRAEPANIVSVAGMVVEQTKPVPMDVQRLLRIRNATAIVWFSVEAAAAMPASRKRDLLEAMRRCTDVTFLWHYNEMDESFADGVTNVVLMKMMLPSDVLADRRVSMVICDAEPTCLQTALHRGVPLIAIPLSPERENDAQNLAQLGAAIIVPRETLEIVLDSEDFGVADYPNAFEVAVRRIAVDKSYSSAARKLADDLRHGEGQSHKLPPARFLDTLERTAKEQPVRLAQWRQSAALPSLTTRLLLDMAALGAILLMTVLLGALLFTALVACLLRSSCHAVCAVCKKVKAASRAPSTIEEADETRRMSTAT